MYNQEYRPQPIPDSISDGIVTVRVFTEKPTDTQTKKVTNFHLRELWRGDYGTSVTMDGNNLYLSLSLNMGNEWKDEEIIELCMPIEKVKKLFEVLRKEIQHAERLQKWRKEEQMEKIKPMVMGENH